MIFEPLVMLLAAAAPLLVAAAEPRPAPAETTVVVKDLTPRFMAFWNAAQARPGLDAEARFRLWKELDGFAAVPPTPEGDRMARRLLDAAWPRYPELVPRIAAGAAPVAEDARAVLRAVAAELRPASPVAVQLTVYGGMGEHNAFTVGGPARRAVVAVPAEMEPAVRRRIMAHEFTHATQIATGASAGGWVRSVGATALAEGLANRVAQKLSPGASDAEIVSGGDPAWLAACKANRRSVLADVRAAALETSSEAVTRFTVAEGPSGLRREAYCAGWFIVDHWTRHGRTLADIARIPEADAPAEVARAVDAMIGPPGKG